MCPALYFGERLPLDERATRLATHECTKMSLTSYLSGLEDGMKTVYTHLEAAIPSNQGHCAPTETRINFFVNPVFEAKGKVPCGRQAFGKPNNAKSKQPNVRSSTSKEHVSRPITAYFERVDVEGCHVGFGIAQ